MTPVQIRQAVLQGITVAVLLAVPAGAGCWLWTKHRWANEQLAQTEPRYARLAGLQQSKDKLTQAEASAKAQLSMHAYPQDQDAVQAGNDAQQRIRALFADSKLDIGSIQVLPPKEHAAFDRIGIVLQVEGDLAGLQNALSLLEKQSPSVWLDSGSIQTVGVIKPKTAQRLSARLNFSVWRVRS